MESEIKHTEPMSAIYKRSVLMQLGWYGVKSDIRNMKTRLPFSVT